MPLEAEYSPRAASAQDPMLRATRSKGLLDVPEEVLSDVRRDGPAARQQSQPMRSPSSQAT